ncbi:indoleamine 2,3-dioxygenase, partial [Lecanoromycetidae sp. Uapishka_2]
MLPPIPFPEDYGVSNYHGFLPEEPPLELLPDPYYKRWEQVVSNLQALLLSRRLRSTIESLPIVTASRLRTEAEWRRAYVLLSFMTHAYIWGGDSPAEHVPPPVSIPFIQICKHLDLPTVATYAGVCLWNWKPIFHEPIDNLENLSTLATFTGSLDESWFYLVSVAIEARGGPTIPLMLDAMRAARRNDYTRVTACLRTFAERLDELGTLLQRMYENCDPHVFYHRIRPFLAGSKNMADAGLPNGVVFDTGAGDEIYCQYGGGSNAQSSLIQFFDIALGVEHRPTGSKKPSDSSTESESDGPTARPPRHNFIHEMRSYMPGLHRQFLHDVTSAANIREYVESHSSNRSLSVAFDACLAMLRSLRDKHIQLVSRYIIVKSRETRSHSRSLSPRSAPNNQPQPLNLASASKSVPNKDDGRPGSKKLRGTGGTALIPFLKQARDETGEPAIDQWAQKLLSSGQDGYGPKDFATLGKVTEHADGVTEVVGLAGVWNMDDSEGGLCHW